MIAFENYERCCTTEISSMEPKEADHYRALLEKKSLEPVDEAFIESDVEPSNLPNVDAQAQRQIQKEKKREDASNYTYQGGLHGSYTTLPSAHSNVANVNTTTHRTDREAADSQSGAAIAQEPQQ